MRILYAHLLPHIYVFWHFSSSSLVSKELSTSTLGKTHRVFELLPLSDLTSWVNVPPYAVKHHGYIVCSDVQTWGWGTKPAQASPGKPSWAWAECMAWEGLGLRLQILKVQAVGLSPKVNVYIECLLISKLFKQLKLIMFTLIIIFKLNLKCCHLQLAQSMPQQ